MSVINIQSNIRHYSVAFAESDDFFDDFEQYPDRCFAIDHNVWRIYEDSLFRKLNPSNIIVVPIGEELKSLQSVQGLYDRLIQRTAKRNLNFISIGGGILQDITGFVSSTLYRGINWIYVPTTLLSQADSCIGGKTSLNYRDFKNLLGTFYPPSEIVIYVPFLLTLQDIDFYSGLGEVIKLHMIGGPEKIDAIIENLPSIVGKNPYSLYNSVRDSLLIKQEFIEGDEFDLGKRAMLNFGHCFGHAIESTSEFEIPHGQAVVLGMILANLVAAERGLLSDVFCEYLLNRLLLPSFNAKLKKDHIDKNKVIEGMKKDKKRTGKGLALVMIGDHCQMYKVNDLTEYEASKALDKIEQILNII